VRRYLRGDVVDLVCNGVRGCVVTMSTFGAYLGCCSALGFLSQVPLETRAKQRPPGAVTWECALFPKGIMHMFRDVWSDVCVTFVFLRLEVKKTESAGLGRCLKRFLEVLRFISTKFQLIWSNVVPIRDILDYFSNSSLITSLTPILITSLTPAHVLLMKAHVYWRLVSGGSFFLTKCVLVLVSVGILPPAGAFVENVFFCL
jgi:hypothetical protein